MNKYAKELIEMLNKDSVEELISFLKERSGKELSPDIVKHFLNASPEVQQLTLWKMQNQCVYVKEHLRVKAALSRMKWRMENGESKHDSKRNKRNKSKSSNDKD